MAMPYGARQSDIICRQKVLFLFVSFLGQVFGVFCYRSQLDLQKRLL
uniref:Uncharacterized protein n=1 Tax=Rhizophora mucronata TaxID=61149 RepID=A0A2P2P0D3_RHIMU